MLEARCRHVGRSLAASSRACRFLARLTVPALLLAVAACSHERILIDPALSPTLEVQADAQAHASMPEGHRLRDVLVGVAYTEGTGAHFMVPLEAGKCYAFGYAADTSAARFSLYLFNPAGRRLDSQRNGPSQGVYNHCAAENGMHRLEAKVSTGAGHFVVVTYATGAGLPAPAPVALTPSLHDVIDRQAASAAPGAKRVGNFFTGTGDQTDWFVQLNAGACYWFIGAGEASRVKSLSMYLWDPRLARITESRSDTETSMIGYCSTVPGMYKFEAKVSSGKGAYEVGVYAK